MVRISNAQALWAAIAAAAPGETIQLASGHYGSFGVTNAKIPAPGLTIEPQPGAKVDFTSLGVYGSENVTIKDVEVNVEKAQFGVEVNGGSHVVLTRLNIHAPPTNVPNAMMVRSAHDVTVEDCDIHNIGFGINLLDSHDVKLLRNNFTDLQVDAIRGQSSNVQVIGNHATSFHPQEGDHPDFIQFWATPEAGPSIGNVIKDNVFERGQGNPVQGIFLEDAKDVVISGNALLGTMYNGVSLSRVQTALIENNFVQGYRDMGTRIITRGESKDVTIRNNVSQEIVEYKDEGKANPRYTQEHNRSIGPARIGDDSALKEWMARPRGG
ncbi:MAG: right-handed parallel beta-helix repeat-containing protein [Caulobacteraceae bacterium]